MNNLPGSPWKRSGIIARAGVKTGGNYIRHHVGNALPIKSLHQDKETLNRKNALSLIKELSQLRGAALKMAHGLPGKLFMSIFASGLSPKYSNPVV